MGAGLSDRGRFRRYEGALPVRTTWGGYITTRLPIRQVRDGAWLIVRPGKRPETNEDDGGDGEQRELGGARLAPSLNYAGHNSNYVSQLERSLTSPRCPVDDSHGPSKGTLLGQEEDLGGVGVSRFQRHRSLETAELTAGAGSVFPKTNRLRLRTLEPRVGQRVAGGQAPQIAPPRG
jgi:hypothetical protein